MDKAIDVYWKARLGGILSKVGTGVSDEAILHLWNEALDDMYGEDHARKKEIYNIALADEQVSAQAKEWLKSLSN